MTAAVALAPDAAEWGESAVMLRRRASRLWAILELDGPQEDSWTRHPEKDDSYLTDYRDGAEEKEVL